MSHRSTTLRSALRPTKSCVNHRRLSGVTVRRLDLTSSRTSLTNAQAPLPRAMRAPASHRYFQRVLSLSVQRSVTQRISQHTWKRRFSESNSLSDISRSVTLKTSFLAFCGNKLIPQLGKPAVSQASVF